MRSSRCVESCVSTAPRSPHEPTGPGAARVLLLARSATPSSSESIREAAWTATTEAHSRQCRVMTPEGRYGRRKMTAHLRRQPRLTARSSNSASMGPPRTAQPSRPTLRDPGYQVVEAGRPDRRLRRMNGKADTLDAEDAARVCCANRHHKSGVTHPDCIPLAFIGFWVFGLMRG